MRNSHARSGRLPRWAKGKKLLDGIDGSELYERDGNTTKQRGQFIHKQHFDKVLDSQRPGGKITTYPPISFAYDSYTKLLLRGGSSSSASIIDEMGNIVTTYGGARSDIIEKPFDEGSILFDGIDDYITVSNFSNLDIAGSDFTFEGRIRFDSLTSNLYPMFFARWGSGITSAYELYYDVNGGNLEFDYTVDGIIANMRSMVRTWSPSINTWYPFSLVRHGAMLIMFIGGIQIGSPYNIGSDIIYNNSRQLSIGVDLSDSDTPYSGDYLEGRIAEFRFSNISRWLGDYPPPRNSYKKQVVQ